MLEKKNWTSENMCEFCHLDEVSIKDIPCCLMRSIFDTCEEIYNGSFTIKSLIKNDRIYYWLLLLIIMLCIRLVLNIQNTEKTSIYTNTNHPFQYQQYALHNSGPHTSGMRNHALERSLDENLNFNQFRSPPMVPQQYKMFHSWDL